MDEVKHKAFLEFLAKGARENPELADLYLELQDSFEATRFMCDYLKLSEGFLDDLLRSTN